MIDDTHDFKALCHLLNLSQDDAQDWGASGHDSGTVATDASPVFFAAHLSWDPTDPIVLIEARTPDPDLRQEEGLDYLFPVDREGVGEFWQILNSTVEQIQNGAEHVMISPATQRLLTKIANYPVPLHVMDGDDEGPVKARLRTTPFCEEIVGAVRALWAVLAGQAELRRCPAPAPRPANCSHQFNMKCDKWFVVGGGEGRPRMYCCDSCAKRASRRGELATPRKRNAPKA